MSSEELRKFRETEKNLKLKEKQFKILEQKKVERDVKVILKNKEE